MQIVPAAIAVLLAYMVKGMCGFGNTLVFSTFMSFFSNTVQITPVEVVMGLPSNAYMCWKERKHFHWKIILPVAAIIAAGCIPGILFLKNASPQILKVVFGFLVIGLGVEMLIRERAQKRKGSRWTLMGIGLLAGVMSGLYGIGALLAAYMSRTTDTPAEFRGNICMTFLITDAVRLALYAATGIITADILMTVLKLFPFSIIGLAGGIFLSKRINETLVKRAIIVLLILSGVSLAITNLL